MAPFKSLFYIKYNDGIVASDDFEGNWKRSDGVVLSYFLIGFLERLQNPHQERSTFLLAEVLIHDRRTTKQEFYIRNYLFLSTDIRPNLNLKGENLEEN
jgi:hypothetical protein